MSRSVRLVGAVALACASVPLLGVAPALADTASVPAGIGAYYSATGIPKPDQSPTGIPVQPNDQGADGVATGNLAVAARGGMVDKVSFLYFDLPIDPASTIQKALLRVPLVESSQSNLVLNADPMRVRVCANDDKGFFGQDGAPIAEAPGVLCDVFSAPAAASADGASYEFDVTGLATTWLTGVNDGLALTVGEGQDQQPFQLVFGPAANATLEVESTPPADLASEPVPTVDTPSGVPAGTGTTPDLGGFGGSPVTPPVLDGGGLVTGPAPTVGDVPTPTVGVAPAPVPAVAQAARAAAVPTSVRPVGAFWVGGFALAALLALLSLVMGDANVPVTSTGPQTRLARTLSARQRGTGFAGLGAPLTT